MERKRDRADNPNQWDGQLNPAEPRSTMLNIVDLGLSSPPPSTLRDETAPKHKERTPSTSITNQQSRPSPHDRDVGSGTSLPMSACLPTTARSPARPPSPS
ncbi:unnamed protein product [Cyclocybe aegerita]|uniref:Uncharacterized protein n=1 Tax=Cyclocybe aegerita TaxID=1973307 RepID=A0A8S0XTJ2_CYCAE|nr:unnamed protein product [Cyclocybe aegerita]